MKIIGFALLIFLASCGTQELVQDIPEKKEMEQYPTKGLMHFMYGEIYRAEGNYVYANLEYRRALEYDTTTTILKAIGESYRRLGKHKLATGYYEKALKLDPLDESAQYNVIDLYMKELRHEEVIPMLQKHLEETPEDPDYLQRLAESYRGINDFEKSLETLDKLIEVSPKHPWPYIYAAEIMLENNRIADAAPYLEEVARNVPPNNELYEFWVRSLFESKNIEGMLSALEFWLDKEPETLAPYFLYIDYKFQMSDFTKGNEILNRIKNRWEEDSRISYFQGISAMEKGEADSVMFFFNRAEKSGANDVDLYLYYSLWFWENGDLETADYIADRAIDKRGPGTRWLHMKAMIRAQQGNWQQSEQLLTHIISIDSSNVNVREDLANVYVEMRQAEKADEIYGGLLEDLPESSSILNNYAYALARLNMDLNRAMSMVNKAIKIEKSAAYCDTKAWIFYRQKKYNKAYKWVQKAFVYSDISAEVYYHKGMILIKLGKIEEAKIALGMSLNIDPNNIECKKALEELE